MADMDVFTVLLPFLLSLALFNFILKDLDIFDEDTLGQKTAGLIALILSLFVAYFLVANPYYQNFFTDYFARIAIGIAGLLGLLIFLAYAGVKPGNVPLVTALVVLGTVGAFAMSRGFDAFLPTSQVPVLDMSIQQIFRGLVDSGVIYLLIIGLAVYYIVHDTRDDEDQTRTGEVLESLLGAD
ncbi:MAG: hypothetical protein H8Z69_02965 [Nanohaloarchaea archaeon]|nr:hypothetical protein [Candidatus Nanohaloarchaea archaeon]